MRPCAAGGRVRIRWRHPVWRHVLRRVLVVHVGGPGYLAAECGSVWPMPLPCAPAGQAHTREGRGRHGERDHGRPQRRQGKPDWLVNHARGQWQAQTSALTIHPHHPQDGGQQPCLKPERQHSVVRRDGAWWCQYRGAEPPRLCCPRAVPPHPHHPAREHPPAEQPAHALTATRAIISTPHQARCIAGARPGSLMPP